MFDHRRIAQQLAVSTAHSLTLYHSEQTMIRQCWLRLCSDELFAQKVKDHPTSLPLPAWHTTLGAVHQSESYKHSYRIIAVDGSQIYPDRHQGLPLYVINLGIADFYYNGLQSNVTLETVPHLFYAHDTELGEDNPELINCHRSELELQQGLLQSKKASGEVPLLFVCDGSLIAWHLSSATELKQKLFERYCALFYELYTHRIVVAGYVSLPKSRDLVQIVSNAYSSEHQEEKKFTYVTDSDLLALTLPPFHRTTIFESRVAAVKDYPEPLRPHFFYMNVGEEIARIEIPAWIAHDTTKIQFIEQTILDQVMKGQGYPISLAESHEQAVIKGPDRELFYQMVKELVQQQGIRYPASQKSLKKRGIGI
jgi:NurA domain